MGPLSHCCIETFHSRRLSWWAALLQKTRIPTQANVIPSSTNPTRSYNLLGASLEARTERGMQWTDHTSANVIPSLAGSKRIGAGPPQSLGILTHTDLCTGERDPVVDEPDAAVHGQHHRRARRHAHGHTLFACWCVGGVGGGGGHRGIYINMYLHLSICIYLSIYLSISIYI